MSQLSARAASMSMSTMLLHITMILPSLLIKNLKDNVTFIKVHVGSTCICVI